MSNLSVPARLRSSPLRRRLATRCFRRQVSACAVCLCVWHETHPMSGNLLLFYAFPPMAVGFAIAAIVFLVWAFLGNRGDPRKRRLRMALSSVLLFVAAVLSAI